ncbi:MAG: hypothetical protein KC438_13495 [Thermomicrobiales bacterium]|nr:hypothetical protein [Thermomicrobiales bacterium]MCO5220101.1 DUF2325 domain-containing protein [Thermomicrobiales bacterium]
MSAHGFEAAGAPLPNPEDLAEVLLDAAATGNFERELAAARAAIDRRQGELESPELFRYRLLVFDLALVSTTNPRLQASAAIDLLSSNDGSRWEAVLQTGRIDEIRRLIGDPELGLELAELLTYAPDPGIRDLAATGLEATGMRLLAAGEETRSIERLLHATGARDHAYRLESARKRRTDSQTGAAGQRAPAAPSMLPGVVAIAGGHAQLRAAAAALLEPYGVMVVPIPSSREAVRRERSILQALQGCDLAMLLVRQITHSTSDQVRRAAQRLDVPVFFSNAASAVAIERQLLERDRAITEE